MHGLARARARAPRICYSVSVVRQESYRPTRRPARPRIANDAQHAAGRDLREQLSPEEEQRRLSLRGAQRKLKEAQAHRVPDPPWALAVQEGGTPGGLFPGIQDMSLTRLLGRLQSPVTPLRLPLVRPRKRSTS